MPSIDSVQAAQLLDELLNELQAVWKHVANFYESLQFANSFRSRGDAKLADDEVEEAAVYLGRALAIKGGTFGLLEREFVRSSTGAVTIPELKGAMVCATQALASFPRLIVEMLAHELPRVVDRQKRPYEINWGNFKSDWSQVCGILGGYPFERFELDGLFQRARIEVERVRQLRCAGESDAREVNPIAGTITPGQTRPGRKRVGVSERDQRLLRDWEAAKKAGQTQAEFAKAKGFKGLRECKIVLDRARISRKRAATNSATNTPSTRKRNLSRES